MKPCVVYLREYYNSRLRNVYYSACITAVHVDLHVVEATIGRILRGMLGPGRSEIRGALVRLYELVRSYGTLAIGTY